MTSLYELTQQALYLQDLLQSGDIDEDTFADTLESLDIETKIENICKVIRNLEADAKAFKEEKDRLAAKQKVAENGVKRLKESLLMHLQVTEQKKVQSGLFKVSVGASKAVEIFDERALLDDYLEPQPDKINKTRIAEDLKLGIEVAGARFVENQYVTIK